MDGRLAPIHRKKRKYIYCDLYSSAIVILVIEMSLLSSQIVYYSIMLWSYNENGGKTTQFLIDEENGVDVSKPLIPDDVIYYLLLIGFSFAIVFCLLLFLGTVWLFPDFLRLWNQGTIISNVYFTVVLVIDSIFTRHSFPIELLFIPIRCYFIFIINAFSAQVKEDAKHDYDYKTFAENHFEETGTKFILSKKKPSSWIGMAFNSICIIAGCARKTNQIAPMKFQDRATVMRNMRKDMELEDTVSLDEIPARTSQVQDDSADPVPDKND